MKSNQTKPDNHHQQRYRLHLYMGASVHTNLTFTGLVQHTHTHTCMHSHRRSPAAIQTSALQAQTPLTCGLSPRR